jgi:peptidoglycan/xylan/chitin deacetylase (PgdA/CDA1 family)/predicted ATP-grasp superfamily ATP-dependent carboligase
MNDGRETTQQRRETVGLWSMLAARPRPRILVLAYHSISDEWRHPLALTPRAFREQMLALRKRGYRAVTFATAAQALIDPTEGPLLAVTFDDGFRTVTRGREILDELGWTATVFVPTAAVEDGAPMRWLTDTTDPQRLPHVLPLSWTDVEALAEHGWEVGSHSRTHPLLSALSDAEAEEELGASRRELERRLGRCSSISYPWGEVDMRVVELARAAGYRFGSGLIAESPPGPMTVPRLAVSANDGPATFGLKTSAAVLSTRGTRAWRAADRIRGHGSIRWPARAYRRGRTALVLDGNTGPALAVTRSLGRDGWSVVTESGTKASWSKHSVGTARLPSTVREPDAFVEALAAAVDRLEPAIVVPATDASLQLAWSAVGDTPTRILGGDRRTVDTALDKVATLRAAERVGFPVPRWFLPESAQEARAAFAELGSPCVVKPRTSYLRRGSELVHRRHLVVDSVPALERALAALSDSGDALPLVQELVPGRAMSATAVVHDGRVLARVARQTLTFYPVAGGTSVWKRTVPADDAGVAEAVELLVRIGLHGLAEVEYQVGSDGRPRLMEIGARIHGWVPLAIAAGVDLPSLAADAAIGDLRPQDGGYAVAMEMRWLAGELLRLRAVTRQDELPVDVTRTSILASAWPPWRPGMRFDGIDRTDLGPLYRSLPIVGPLLRRGANG